MTCKDVEKLIPIFIKDELNYRELEQFIDHIESCPSCKEEMSIQFLVTEGMARLEDGSAFDLNQELRNLMDISKSRIRVHKGMQYLGIGIEVVALVAILSVIIVILL